MHNMFANFVKILVACKHFAQGLVKEKTKRRTGAINRTVFAHRSEPARASPSMENARLYFLQSIQ